MVGITVSFVGLFEKAYACDRIRIDLRFCKPLKPYGANRNHVINFRTLIMYQDVQQ